MNHTLILSTSEERTLKSNARNTNTILMESKPEVKKTLICLKSKEGTAESSGATSNVC